MVQHPALQPVPDRFPPMKTKSVRSLLGILGCLALVPVSLSAQAASGSTPSSDTPRAGAENGGRGRGRGMAPGSAATPDAQVQRLTAAVALTDEQKAKILAIYKDEATKLQAVRDDTKLTQPERMAKLQEIQIASRAAVRALLTADQQKKFDAMPAANAGGRGNRGNPGGGGPGGGGRGGPGGRGAGGRGGGGGGGGAAN
jgi:protein CpxP